MMNAGVVKEILAASIQLADQVTKWADDGVHFFRQECLELKAKTERLGSLLRQAARSELYERPARRIMKDTGQVLEKALALVDKCRAHGFIRRLFTIIPAGAFKKMSTQLDNSVGDVSWLIRVSSTSGGDDDGDIHLGLPPIAQNEPILFLIWEQIATLLTGSLEARSDAAASLVSLARDNERYGKLIIEEDGVVPLLRLIKEGHLEGQENAAHALGLLARDPESVEQMVVAGVCSTFSKVLKEGPMKVQAMVAWAVSELAASHPKSQDVFSQNNVVRLLVSHLAFETVQEHSKYTIPSKGMSIHSVVMANSNSSNSCNDPNSTSAAAAAAIDDCDHPLKHSAANQNQMHNVVQSTIAAKSSKTATNSNTHNPHAGSNGKPHHVSLAGTSIKGREFEEPATKAYMKAMAAKALCHLAKGNAAICKSITESRALLCFAVLLEKGTDEVRCNSAMALMEITRVAEEHSDLRRSAFKPNAPAARAVVDQLLRIVEKADYDDLLVPCIVSLGCLARTFRATETRIIPPLVRLLDDTEAVVAKEVAIALNKFACRENYLHLGHAKAIINAGGAKHLVQLVYFGEHLVQNAALLLLCYIAEDVPDSEALAQADVPQVLEWASKQGYMVQDPTLEALLPAAKMKLELYQARCSKGGYQSYH